MSVGFDCPSCGIPCITSSPQAFTSEKGRFVDEEGTTVVCPECDQLLVYRPNTDDYPLVEIPDKIELPHIDREKFWEIQNLLAWLEKQSDYDPRKIDITAFNGEKIDTEDFLHGKVCPDCHRTFKSYKGMRIHSGKEHKSLLRSLMESQR